MSLRRSTFLSLCIVAVVLVGGSASAQFPDQNHYKCYSVESEVFEPLAVELKDQFGGSRARVLIPRYLCNPVDKNGEGIPNREVHQVCYEIVEQPDHRRHKVLTSNQFGELVMKTVRPELLCVPSKKEILGVE